MKIPLVAVCGPTASGKTSLAVELAKRFDGEVVSSDSMQIYKGMDIGTAKPTEEEKQSIPHHMIDVADIDCNFSVNDYCTMAHDIIADIYSRGKLPVLAGGTGLYVDSLINDIDFTSSDCNDRVRSKYSTFAEEKGKKELHRLLEMRDPAAAADIHMNNVKRVIRALEHIEVTGERFSEYKKRAACRDSRYNALMLFIAWDREELYKRIDLRVDMMINEGLLSEAREIYDKGYSREFTSMCAIGYKELFEYFDGKSDLDAAVDSIKQNSRRYAKRQLTWFRRNDNVCYIPAAEDIEQIAADKVKNWLEENYNGKIHI